MGNSASGEEQQPQYREYNPNYSHNYLYGTNNHVVPRTTQQALPRKAQSKTYYLPQNRNYNQNQYVNQPRITDSKGQVPIQPISYAQQQYIQQQQRVQQQKQQYQRQQPQQLVKRSMNSRTNNRLGMQFQYPNGNLNMGNVNSTMKNLNQIERNEREAFNREQREREQAFENEQKKRRSFFDDEIKKFEQNYNPYAILGLDEYCTLTELKKKYKKMAIKYHPDRNNGQTGDEFKLITQSYLYILKNKENDNSLSDKINREVTHQRYTDNINEQRENIYLDKDNFDLDKFNEIFNQYKIPTAFDNGYSDMMSSSNRDKRGRLTEEQLTAGNKGEIFGNDFNIDVFNKTFKDAKTSRSTQIIQYEEPQAVNTSKNMQFSELGVDQVDNYGVKNDGLGYTDYRIAHKDENMLIDVDSVKVKSYKSVNHLKADRENISYTLSDEDRRLIELRKQQENEREQRRLNNMRSHDRMVGDQYNRINHLMISNRPTAARQTKNHWLLS